MNELIENRKKSEILADHIASMGYGDAILHTEIETIINERYRTPKYRSEIMRTKKILRERYHREIKSVRGDGYRVVEPDDVVSCSISHYRRGFNQMQAGMNVLKNAPVEDMTEEGKEVYKRVSDRSVILLASLKGARAELKTLSRRNPLHPDIVGRR